jgi:TRAP-type C4-dicarboxylate transport system permease small subunit
MTSAQAKNSDYGVLERKINLLEKGCTFIASVAFVVMVIIIAVGTLSRYFLARPLVFVDEYSGYLLVAMGFLAMVSAVKRDLHITVDIVTKAFPEKVRAWLDVGAQSIAILISAVLFWLSLTFCLENYTINLRASTIMETPLWIPQLFIPLGWLVFILFVAMRVGNKVRSIRKSGKETIQ